MPDYGSIIRRSIEIVKKNKWLLVYGLLLASGGGGSGSGGGGGGGGSSFNNTENLPKEFPQDFPEKTSQVLGAFTGALKAWFLNVDPSKWILIIFGFFVVIALSIVVGMVIRNWANGALISGVEMALKDQEVNLKNTSPQGLASVKNLIIYSLMVTGMVLALLITLPSFWLLVYFFVRNLEVLKTIWIVLGIILGFLTFLVALVIISIVDIYAGRLIVLRGYKPWEAWKKGLSIGKKGFMATIVMGIINSAIGFGVGCVSIIALLLVLGIPGFIFISSLIKGQVSAINIIGIVLLLFIFIYTNLIIRAALVVFNYANWNQIFNHFISQVENQEKS